MDRFYIDCYISDHIASTIELSDESFILTRKRIAEVCKSIDIKQGEFKNKNATKIIRSMQKALFEEFERTISKYDKHKLHVNALNMYVTSLLDIYKDDHRIFYQFEKENKGTINLL
jgi:hypothetical protein